MAKETWHMKTIRKMVNANNLTDSEAVQLIARLDYIRKYPDPSFIEDENGKVTPLKDLRPLKTKLLETDVKQL